MALKTAGQAFPIPGIAVATNITLEILGATKVRRANYGNKIKILSVCQALKNNKEFIATARDCCDVMETVVRRVQFLKDPAIIRQDADVLLSYADLPLIQ